MDNLSGKNDLTRCRQHGDYGLRQATLEWCICVHNIHIWATKCSRRFHMIYYIDFMQISIGHQPILSFCLNKDEYGKPKSKWDESGRRWFTGSRIVIISLSTIDFPFLSDSREPLEARLAMVRQRWRQVDSAKLVVASPASKLVKCQSTKDSESHLEEPHEWHITWTSAQCICPPTKSIYGLPISMHETVIAWVACFAVLHILPRLLVLP